jgi:hypothetical protein
MDGRYGLSRLLDEKPALTFHRMLHIPLIILVLVHSVPAVCLAAQRWGWVQSRSPGGALNRTAGPNAAPGQSFLPQPALDLGYSALDQEY